MDILLSNGFKEVSDWDFGLVYGFGNSMGYYTIKLMDAAEGHWIILDRRVGSDTKSTNLGCAKSVDDIIAVKKTLEALG